MNLREELLVLLNNLGITVDDNGEFGEMDSVEFISMIVNIEEAFEIEFPDDLITMTLVNSVEKLEIIIRNCLVSFNQ